MSNERFIGTGKPLKAILDTISRILYMQKVIRLNKKILHKIYKIVRHSYMQKY